MSVLLAKGTDSQWKAAIPFLEQTSYERIPKVLIVQKDFSDAPPHLRNDFILFQEISYSPFIRQDLQHL